MKLFYSWQMDAPRKTNKDFIHSALLLAVGKLSDDMDVSEAERQEIEVDQDTQGVLGSPDIVRVILEKIASSNVVVADVSLVARGNGDKKHINSNVAIELGYTYGKIGDEAVLKIMNTHYGPADELPFDLRTRRHPVQYCLDPSANAEAIASERKKLAGQLAGILKLYMGRPSPEADLGHVETPSVGMRGKYWSPGEVIVPEERPYVSAETRCDVDSVIYFRCIPKTELPTLTSREAYDATADLQPLLSEGGYSRSRNKWGAIAHCIARDGDFLGFTQLFKNREIWGVDAYYSNVSTRPEDEDEDPKRIIPTTALNRDYPRAISSLQKAAASLGYGESYTIEMGVSGAAGLHLAIDRQYWESYPGPMYEGDVFVRKTVSSDFKVGEILNAFWDAVFSEAGRKVPEELVWQ
ncbi:hypothetical protein [Ruegeria arenilitoris]|uniref:hypothetical protein n=1 Tax=Ruegeria arenilitoris TaxID=1173585 RepID=UPI00147D4DAC|nr:hypothetical protein [Ruegeria arenilitoris]